MSKRILSLVLAFVMVLGTFGTVFAEVAGPTSNDKVNKLIELGLVKGDGNDYRLSDSIRRDEVAAMVVRSMDLESVANAMINVPTKFADVKAGEWNNGYVAVAEGRGITNGTGLNTFSPARPITYSEVAAMLVRVLGGLTAEETKTAVWPATYIAKAHEMGILADVAIVNMNEMAIRENVFEMVYNTINNKNANLLVANTVEGIVVENYRTENLAKDDIVVHVMKDQVQKSENKYYEAGDEFKITIDKELKSKGYDVETLLGKVVTISYDKAGKVVEIKVNNDYQYVEGKLALANSKEIKLGGKYYTVNKEESVRITDLNKDNRLYQAYYNNKDYHYDKFVGEVDGVEYAKATVRNGKVLFVEAFNFLDIAPVAKDINAKDLVAYYDDYRDGEIRDLKVTEKAYVINYEKNDKTEKYEITLGNYKEIEANDVIHWFEDYKGNLTVFVRAEADNKVEGEYKEANAAKAKEDADIMIEVDGKEYPALIDENYRIPVYSTLMDEQEFLKLSDDYDFDLEPFEKKDVVVLRDMFGYVQLIGTQTKDGRFFAVIADLMNYDFTLVRNNEEGQKGKGDDYTVSLRGTTFQKDGKKLTGTKELQLEAFDVTDLVLVTAEDDKITVLDERTQAKKTIEALNKDVIDFGGSDWTYISKSAIVFDVVGAPKATTIKEVNDTYFYKDHPEVKGYIVTNDKGLATVIVITNGTAKEDKTLSDGTIVEVTRVRMRSDKYYLTVETADRTETTHLVKGKDAIKLVQDTTVEAGTIINIKFLKGEKIADEPAIQNIDTIFVNPMNTFEIVTLGKKDIRGEREIKLADSNGDELTRWISRDANVFGSPKVGDLVAVREMEKYDRIDVVYVTGTATVKNPATAVWPAEKLVEDLINNLPAKIDLKSADSIKKAIEAYNSLEDEERALLDPALVAELEKAIEEFNKLDSDVELPPLDGSAPGTPEVEEVTLDENIDVVFGEDTVTVTIPPASKNAAVGEVEVKFNKEIAEIWINGENKTSEFEEKFELVDGVYVATLNSTWATLLGNRTQITVKVVDVDGLVLEFNINIAFEKVTVRTLEGTADDIDVPGSWTVAISFEKAESILGATIADKLIITLADESYFILDYIAAGNEFINVEIAGQVTEDLLLDAVVSIAKE